MKSIDETLTEIKIVLDRIIGILDYAGDNNWNNTMKSFRERCELSDEDGKLNLLSEIRGVYAGMGSFSDLVLYKNGILLANETSRLDELRTKLFDLAK
jgi:hypothetical protein